MHKKLIMIVDDDVYIGDMLEELLTKNGYDTMRAYSGTEALLALSTRTPDLILLDLMLPGISGEDLLPKLKNIPVIAVSAKVGIESKINMLMNGAVDYITKPFDNRELLARISLRLRENSTVAGESLDYGNIKLDTLNYSASVDKKEVKLTKTEYAILLVLMRNKDKVVTKERIMSEIEIYTPDCEDGALRTHIGNLRNKLRLAGGSDWIEAVWGIGYRLKN